MPKEKSSQCSSCQKHGSYPSTKDESEHIESRKRSLKPGSKGHTESKKRSLKAWSNEHTESKNRSLIAESKEWEAERCPICMDHPHNAVLLICSSHDKGCRPYVCNTSYRHSNCLDQYWRAHSRVLKNCDSRECALDNLNRLGRNSQSSRRTGRGSTRAEPSRAQDYNHRLVSVGSYVDHSGSYSSQAEDHWKALECPLCRGKVYEWKVVAAARKYLNLKARSCAEESCSFTANYKELRAHARREHPFARPSDVDPAHERAWRCLVQQTNMEDMRSSVRSVMPHVTVMGDYVIEYDWEDNEYDNENYATDWENEYDSENYATEDGWHTGIDI